MKIIEPTAELMTPFDGEEVLKFIESCGRVCYRSTAKEFEGVTEKFIRNLILRGHESVLEHFSCTFKIVCDRGVMAELTRHRIASFCVTGDTIIPSYSSNKRTSGKKRTIEEIYKWAHNPQCHAAFNALVIRSLDEQTHTIKPNKIKNVFYNGIQDVFKITTESGRMLKCTAGHRFFTDSGWKKLQDINVGDTIYSNGIPVLENEDWIRHNYLTLNKTRAQVALEAGCCEATLYKAFKKFGIVKPWSDRPNRHPGHGVKGMFTDAQRQDISARMSGENHPSYKHDRNTLSISGGYNEANHKFAAQKKHCENCNSETNLEIHHKDKNPKNNSESNIKILCSQCHHLWHNPFAIGAFKDKVVEVCYSGKESTYDLEMESPYHNYVANGIVVHNSVESTRYCDYSKDDLTFIKPPFDSYGFQSFLHGSLWFNNAIKKSKNYYNVMRKENIPPEIARAVLPMSLATTIIMTANLREWRHVLKLRTASAAHPQMRQVANMILIILKNKLPVVFEDVGA